ncbi:MAG: hypothetical protein A2741_02200 [Candidatus Zambryskibacteria bacterium RIFCSPHIGHO2_01_FULL_43_27]|uniref:Uncharacterized protein n=1 Tax=Candidatus Zambryskibacteria bacterium RIFCSPLOWO2_01_FULL_43_17 TaxID=1802760 RepID=A0A1G2U4Z4_9BACT|nr:MAG: hypothetical protein A2741_02200 [Candidatus Zambryskibacteria bacterium RIFCSPHIGHO2_01_FULL_43_27]OHB00492.1 MAG: hypothetical protein A3E93_01690 [Candidatus Zambryskibacteria bacterium RIFCSPHIGHO2_12_FULL_43_12b]OHB04559.1 MAG: hypothetical protein A2920_01270 [Candidatus Zambryskibacteria bacterium RIFCSPLOWO2_01_FULL_43_17]
MTQPAGSFVAGTTGSPAKGRTSTNGGNDPNRLEKKLLRRMSGNSIQQDMVLLSQIAGDLCYRKPSTMAESQWEAHLAAGRYHLGKKYGNLASLLALHRQKDRGPFLARTFMEEHLSTGGNGGVATS